MLADRNHQGIVMQTNTQMLCPPQPVSTLFKIHDTVDVGSTGTPTKIGSTHRGHLAKQEAHTGGTWQNRKSVQCKQGLQTSIQCRQGLQMSVQCRQGLQMSVQCRRHLQKQEAHIGGTWQNRRHTEEVPAKTGSTHRRHLQKKEAHTGGTWQNRRHTQEVGARTGSTHRRHLQKQEAHTGGIYKNRRHTQEAPVVITVTCITIHVMYHVITCITVPFVNGC